MRTEIVKRRTEKGFNEVFEREREREMYESEEELGSFS
jgi:hypothetical protein